MSATKSASLTKPSNGQLSEFSKEEKEEMKRFMRGFRIQSIISIIFFAIMGYLVINEKINLAGNIKVEELKDLPSRIVFVLKYLTLGVTWILFCIFYVGSKRGGSPAVNPLSGHEHLTQAAKNILNNSMEQFIISAVSQLILVSNVDSVETIYKLIPAVNVIFLIGRITFWLGYPRFRSFGMQLTLFPTLGIVGYNLIKYTGII